MDNEIASKIKDGDKDAFEKFYKKYFRKIWNTVASRVNILEDTEDIVQEVMIEIVENIDKFNPKWQFSTWIYSITKNKINDHLRKKYRSVFVRIDMNVFPERLIDEEDDGSEYIRKKVDKIISNIPEKFQRILKLKYLEKRTYSQIEKLLGISISNAKVIHHRAINHIKEHIDEYK